MKRVALVGPADRAELIRLGMRLEERGAEGVVVDSHRSREILIDAERVEACGVDLTGCVAVYVADLGIRAPWVKRDDGSCDVARSADALRGSRRQLIAWNTLLDHLVMRAKVVNPPGTHDLHSLKPWEIAVCRRAGFPVPRTVSTGDPVILTDLPGSPEHNWVSKGMVGGYGYTEAFEPPSNLEEARRWLDAGPLMLQERVEGDNVRAFVLDGRVIGAAEVTSAEHDATDSRRGETRMRRLSLPPEAERTAIDAADRWGMIFCAVDFMRDAVTGSYLLLECNSAPFFVNFEKRSGCATSPAHSPITCWCARTGAAEVDEMTDLADNLVQELLDADDRCMKQAEVFLDALNDHPSPVGYRRLTDAIDAARERAEGVPAGSGAGSLLARHLRSSWRTLEAVARYRFRWPEVPVAELIESLAGTGAVGRLEGFVSRSDPEAAWSYIRCRHAYRAGRVSAEHPEARQRIEQTAARLTAKFRAWLEAKGWGLPGLDAEVAVGSNDADHSWYQPGPHVVILGAAEFMVFERDGRLTVNPVIALHSLAHELAGHAVQDALSRELPPPLRPDDRSRLRFATLPIAEGFARHVSSLAHAFALEKGADLGLDETDVDFLGRMNEMSVLHHAVPALVSVLAVRARQEPGFDAPAHMAERCGHPGFGEMLENADREPAYRLVYDNSCFFGTEEVRDTAVELESRGVEGGEAIRALGTGAWALDCYRDAVLERLAPAAAGS